MARRPTLDALAATAAPAVRAQLAARRPAVAPKRPAPRAGTLDAAAGAVHHRRSTPAAGVVVVEVPGLRLVNPLNKRQHWRAVYERGQREKAATLAALYGRKPPALPALVTITRVSPGVIGDDDGVTASAKHVRDTVARWLGVDDGDRARVRFVVAQEKGAAGVRITAEPWVARRVECPSCGCSVAVEGSDGR